MRISDWSSDVCFSDLIEAVEAAGEMQTIAGAETQEEIGGIVDIYQRQRGNKAVMFDEVPGYPRGFRVLSNILTSVPRINIALGLKPDASEMDLIHWWRDYMRDKPSFKPMEVNGGPLLENVSEGADVDITTIPTPKRSAEHTSELQSLMRISYAVFCLKKNRKKKHN